jgi:hypothetical protein
MHGQSQLLPLPYSPYIWNGLILGIYPLTNTHKYICQFFPCVQKWSISLGFDENIVEFCKDLDIKNLSIAITKN